MARPEIFVPNEQLRRARNFKGWTQTELAEQVGTSFEIVSRWERGISIPSPYFRKRLCTVLGKTAEELGFVGGGTESLMLPSSPLVALASSHVDEEKAIVAHLTMALQDHGITVMSSRQIGKWGGEHPQKAIREIIRAAHVILVILSPEARTSRHIRQALELAHMYNRRVYSVWIEGEDWQACLPKGGSALSLSIDARNKDGPKLLKEVMRILQQSEHSANTTSISASVQLEEAPTILPPRNPYKGLEAFHSEDRQDFFGRDSLIEELTVALQSCLDVAQSTSQCARLLTITGPSGSGKSSIMLAGLLPSLQGGKLNGSENWVYLNPIVPGIHPLESLALALTAYLPDRSLQMLHEDLKGDSARGLHLLTTALIKQQENKVFLFVDQFEELFSPAIAEEERQHFIDLLLTAVTEPRGSLIVILALRADFSDRPMHYPELYRLLMTNHKVVLAMEINDLRSIIERPAALPDVQLTFEGDLVGDLMFESQGQPGALPLLEFTLTQLFVQRRGHTLTLQAYQQMGGIKGTLARHAEETYASLPSEEHRRLTRSLFLRLIQPGMTVQDTTRRRASLSELRLVNLQETIILEEATRAFITARLLTATTIAGVAMVEVSHEAVIREWSRLADWLREARADIRLQQAISQDAAAWEHHGKPGDHLYRGSRLRDAQAWAARNAPSRSEVAFIRASTRQRARLLGSVLLICLLLLSLTTIAIQLGLNQPPDSTHVTNLQDDGVGSLRWAVDNAPNGSTITFDERLKGQVIKLTSGDLLVTRNLRIQGTMTENLTISSDSNIGNKSIIISNQATVTIANVSFKSTTLSGGDRPAIINSATLTLINSTISGYFTSSDGSYDIQGGGITNSGRLTLINSTVEDNKSNDGTGGGGILNFNSSMLTLINSTIAMNGTTGNGGGILNGGILIVNNSTIVGNNAEDGGGIFNNGTLTITNSTITSNSSDREGGGIFNLQGPDAQIAITFCTIFGNKAVSQGGGIYNDFSNKQPVISNSIIAGNSALTSSGISGAFISKGYNLFQDTNGAVFMPNSQHITDFVVAPNTNLRIDFHLSGQPPQTLALLPGSPAIDAIPLDACFIKTISIDQRGIKRPDGHEYMCDIGAYEYSD